ncbi:hypothetical protein XELAEV_18017884mg [Xenopus laevis]|uniref:Uncharacterized protein n=1 Tax=Xenopus laevis TaxID=8355 RepID=A0A974DC94_XENLA|nr:hypothetical protein XELAEV_18017884mg [Xenopus laevis]
MKTGILSDMYVLYTVPFCSFILKIKRCMCPLNCSSMFLLYFLFPCHSTSLALHTYTYIHTSSLNVL